jgi:hypoxia up-regulated 1
MMHSSFAAWVLSLVAGVGLLLSASVSGKAILGVDLGSLNMKVALVQRGAPLEIVTNMHSKRMTEQMILFDQGTRFYGADASSLLARKSTKTPVAMSILLGRDEDHPAVKVRK